jgi:uncharacterized protein YdeI (BOF family)
MKRVVGVSFLLLAIGAIPVVVKAQANTQAVPQVNTQPRPQTNGQLVAQANNQTSIQALQRANTVEISGQIVQLFREDFVLNDGTGQILVEAEDRPLREAKFSVGDRVTVAGTYDDDNSFEAISVTRQNGEIVYMFDD